MQKKGILINNALTLVIAIIGLVILAYGAYKIYDVTIDQEIKSAQSTIDSLMAKINALEEGQKNTFSIRGVNSQDNWFLTGWDKNDPNRIDKCFLNSCICVCRPSGSPREQSCEEKSICREIEQKKVKIINEEYRGGDGINPLETYNTPVIRLPSKLILVKVEKTQDTLILTDPTQDKLPVPGAGSLP